MHHKPEHLVVDTTAFIQNAPLQEMGNNIFTIQEVVNEITSKRQIRRLVVLPYDLKIMNVFPENISFITEFSKKTGDYPSLSATDIKLMALVYQLEKQYVGIDHLRTAPVNNKVVSLDPPELSATEVVGFFKGGHKEVEENTEMTSIKEMCDSNSEQNSEVLCSEIDKEIVNEEQSESQRIDHISVENNDENSLINVNEDEKSSLEVDFSTLTVTDVLQSVSEEEYETDDEEDDGEDYEDSDWITPENVKQAKQQMNFGLTEEKPVSVGCVTTDFAMQNVMKQIGLNIVGLDGRVIKHLRTFIFRCYACFRTTSNMTKVFCPKCGNKTLKKVAVSVDENGQQKIHINPKRPLTARGKKFSLPRPKGGKHANNPILCEDQPTPDQRPSRLARTKTNALDGDYIAGFSPFVMRDVNSKSAVLGIRGKNEKVCLMKVFTQPNLIELLKQVEGSIGESDGRGYSKWVQSHLLDLEGPAFQYKPIFMADSNIQDFIRMVKEAELQTVIRLDEELQREEKMGFWERLLNGGGGEKSSLNERKNVMIFISACVKNLIKMYQIPEESLEQMTKSVLNTTPVTSRPTSINEMTPSQMRSKLRDLKYEGDPDLQPIRSYENAFLVRLFYHLCLWINYNYSNQMLNWYMRRDLVGGVVRQVLCGPQVIYHFDKRVPGMSPRISNSLPPRLSLRMLANYHLLAYTGLLFLLVKLMLGLSLSAVFVVFIFLWGVFMVVRWLLGYAPVVPVVSVLDISDSRPNFSFSG